MGQARRRAEQAARRRPRSARCSTPATWSMSSRSTRTATPRRPIPPAAGAGSLRRDGGDGPADRPRAGDGRRLLLRPEPVQPRDAGLRQPGSSFKPFVYAAALDNGYTPSTVVMDAPIEIDQGQGAGVWRPENYSTGKFYGPVDAALSASSSRAT